jgi:hypothetical protein
LSCVSQVLVMYDLHSPASMTGTSCKKEYKAKEGYSDGEEAVCSRST